MENIHRNIIEAVIISLQQIFKEGKFADKVVEKVLRSNPKWGSRDRRFIAESIYEIVRWWRLLKYATGQDNDQMQTDYWQIIAAYFLMGSKPLPPWKEFEGLDVDLVKNKFSEAAFQRKIIESIPDWLDEAGSKQLGTNWDKELHALNEPALVVLRANILKTNVSDLEKELERAGIETANLKGFPDALVLKKRQNLFQNKLYLEGHFEIQDASSQLVAPFLKAEPGMTVVDACAGAGGKSLHIAAFMRNKGLLMAMDIEERKLDELNRRAHRAGIKNLKTQTITDVEDLQSYHGTADRLLLDVPCSGLGVLRRNPDAKWKLSPEFIAKVQATQQDILVNYAPILKKGGLMVYATCSILPSENSEQVERFLTGQGENFSLVEEKKIMPSSGNDGFYLASMMKL